MYLLFSHAMQGTYFRKWKKNPVISWGLESWQCCLFCCQVLIIANKGQEITYFLYIFRYMIQYVCTQSTNTYYSHGHENLYGVSENMHIYHMMKEQKCPSVVKRATVYIYTHSFMKKFDIVWTVGFCMNFQLHKNYHHWYCPF